MGFRPDQKQALGGAKAGWQQFFAKLGFEVAQREDLPDKINKDCCVCPRYHNCDEVAMVRGELPKFAILPEPANWLVKLQV